MAIRISPTVVNIAKKLAGKPMAAASKIIGAATIASVVYDSYVTGKEKAIVTDETESGNRLFNLNKQYLTMNGESATVAAMKKGWYLSQMTNSTCHLLNKIGGALMGAGQTIFNEAPMIALSAIAISFGKVGKIPVGKIAGSLLGLSWAKTFLYDVLGFGNNNKYKL